jgi:DNA repair photolyase
MQHSLASSPPLVQPRTGIARLAAESPQVRERAQVAYFALPVRSALNRESSGNKPFFWTLNPYRGCEFGCKYCYARYTHEFMEKWDGLDFERKIYAKVGSPELLRAELRRAQDKGLPIALGSATDPFQPAEKQFGITRRLLAAFAEFEGLRLSIITKSALVTRDLDLLKLISRRHRFSIHVTVTTTDEHLARLLEPKAPPPARRLEAVKKLVSDGIYAGVNVMPIMPEINDSPTALEDLARQAAAAGARFMHGNALYLMPAALMQFMPFLEKEFPHLVRLYRKLYARSAYLPKEYQEKIADRVAILRARYNLIGPGPQAPTLTGPAQLALW